MVIKVMFMIKNKKFCCSVHHAGKFYPGAKHGAGGSYEPIRRRLG